MPQYDALLIVSFGGPERAEDVMPFLENVLRGRNVPRERMLAVAEHYYHFGGRSPINDYCRGLMAALSSRGAAADLLGESQLAPDAGRYHAADGARWRAAGAGDRDLGLRRLFRMPAISGGHRGAPAGGWAGRAGSGQAAAVRRASAIYRSQCQPRGGRAGGAGGGGTRQRAAGVHGAQHSAGDVGHMPV